MNTKVHYCPSCGAVYDSTHTSQPIEKCTICHTVLLETNEDISYFKNKANNKYNNLTWKDIVRNQYIKKGQLNYAVATKRKQQEQLEKQQKITSAQPTTPVVQCPYCKSGLVKKCAVKIYPKSNSINLSASIALVTTDSFSEFCQGCRRHSV